VRELLSFRRLMWHSLHRLPHSPCCLFQTRFHQSRCQWRPRLRSNGGTRGHPSMLGQRSTRTSKCSLRCLAQESQGGLRNQSTRQRTATSSEGPVCTKMGRSWNPQQHRPLRGQVPALAAPWASTRDSRADPARRVREPTGTSLRTLGQQMGQGGLAVCRLARTAVRPLATTGTMSGQMMKTADLVHGGFQPTSSRQKCCWESYPVPRLLLYHSQQSHCQVRPRLQSIGGIRERPSMLDPKPKHTNKCSLRCLAQESQGGLRNQSTRQRTATSSEGPVCTKMGRSWNPQQHRPLRGQVPALAVPWASTLDSLVDPATRILEPTGTSLGSLGPQMEQGGCWCQNQRKLGQTDVMRLAAKSTNLDVRPQGARLPPDLCSRAAHGLNQ